VILGASKLEQLEENLKSSEVIDLLDEEIQKELLSI
jgi:aryl-alcohol dehydrogenase-like predicted oxidoreductase